MGKFMRYLGIMIELVGVIILAMYFWGIFESNAALLTAGFILVGGVIAHVILNKVFLED